LVANLVRGPAIVKAVGRDAGWDSTKWNVEFTPLCPRKWSRKPNHNMLSFFVMAIYARLAKLHKCDGFLLAIILGFWHSGSYVERAVRLGDAPMLDSVKHGDRLKGWLEVRFLTFPPFFLQLDSRLASP
jgi:hypothetical protein